MLKYLRVFIPTWNFFDIAPEPIELDHRTSLDGVQYTEWTSTLLNASNRVRLNRGLGSLFSNPEENTLIAAHALLERFATEWQDLGAPSWTTIKTTEALVKFYAPKMPIIQFQVKIGNQNYVSSPFGNLMLENLNHET